MKKHHLKLGVSEQAVLEASAQIFASFVAAGQYHEAQENELATKSVRLALMLAEQVEQKVVGDEELP